MRQKYWGPSLFNPNSPHYSSDDFYPTGLLKVEIAEPFLADTFSGNLSQYISIEDAAAEALAKHKGYLPSLNRLTELSETSSEALAKFQGNSWSKWADVTFGRRSGGVGEARGRHLLQPRPTTTIGIQDFQGRRSLTAGNSEPEQAIQQCQQTHKGGLRIPYATGDL